MADGLQRLEGELALLRGSFPDLEYLPDGRWVRLPNYRLPEGVWEQDAIEVCFQMPVQLPGQAPYGFYVRPHLTLANGQAVNNYVHPAPTAFGDDWGKFSWQLDPWAPATDVVAGTNMLNFARSIAQRLTEGS